MYIHKLISWSIHETSESFFSQRRLHTSCWCSSFMPKVNIALKYGLETASRARWAGTRSSSATRTTSQNWPCCRCSSRPCSSSAAWSTQRKTCKHSTTSPWSQLFTPNGCVADKKQQNQRLLPGASSETLLKRTRLPFFFFLPAYFCTFLLIHTPDKANCCQTSDGSFLALAVFILYKQ